MNKDQFMARLFAQYFSAALLDTDDEFSRVKREMMEA